MIQDRSLLAGTLFTAIALLLIIPAYAPTTLITETDITTATVNAVDVKASHDVNATRVFANGVQLTGGGGGFTSNTYNLTLSTYSTIIDDDVPNFLITDTSKPTNPQYTRTIQSSDIPVNTGNIVKNFYVVLTFGGTNAGADTTSLFWTTTRNGNEVDPDGASFVANSGTFYGIAVTFSPASAGDTFGIKLWASNPSEIRFDYVTIYILPREINVPANSAASIGVDFVNVMGSVSGVTYERGQLPSGTFAIEDTDGSVSPAPIPPYNSIVFHPLILIDNVGRNNDELFIFASPNFRVASLPAFTVATPLRIWTFGS